MTKTKTQQQGETKHRTEPSVMRKIGLRLIAYLPFIFAVTASSYIAYIIYNWNNSPLSAIETNILTIIAALTVYQTIQFFIKMYVEKKETSKYLTTQSQLNDILTKADIVTKNLIIDILGRCEILHDTQRSHVNKEHVKEILKSTSRLESYINNALHTVEVNANSKKTSSLPVQSFRDTIAPTIEKCSIYAKWNNISLSYKISPEVPNQMDIDIQSFKIALRNTLQSTINTTTSSKIELVIEPFTPDGINTFLRQSVVTSAHKGKVSTSTPQQNDDISYYITQTIVNDAGGFIEKSTTHSTSRSQKYYNIYIPYTPYVGTTHSEHHGMFTQKILSSPLNITHTNSKQLLSNEAKILIVDDHPTNIMLLHKFLEQESHQQIDEASNGEQAIQMYNMHHHHIIFMDCQMPNIDGFLASKEIRSIEKKKGLPPSIIIGVTADTTRTARKKSHECGMNELIYKPVSRDLITYTLSKYVKRKQTEPAHNEKSKEKQKFNSTDEVSFTAEIEIDERTTFIQQTPSNAQLPINLKRLRDCIDDDDGEEEVFFNLFIEQAKESLYVLEQTLKQHNLEDWSKAAHKLKGSSANLGAEQLAELCQIAEHHDSTIADEDILKAIKSELDKVDRFINSILNDNMNKDNKQNSTEHIH